MYTNALSLFALVGTTLAHMHLNYPPSLKGDTNPYTQGEPDPYLNYPYGCCGRELPGVCRGHLDLLDTDEGKPVATWSPGQKVNFTLSGHSIQNTKENVVGGTHYGGSCQAGFSTDRGKTFKVASTWQGNCPNRQGSIDPSTQSFDLTVPADIPSGDQVVFAWVWVNREKEFFMDCSVVSIAGDGQTEQPDNPPASQQPSYAPTPAPTPTGTSPEQPKQTGNSQYTLEGCTCECPSQTWSSACSCYDCQSPATKRHLVERQALELHKRQLQNAAKLNAPVRRAETVAFADRPDMMTSIDFAGASCHSQGNPVELEFPDPGPDVVQGDGEYKLAPPTCS